MPIIHPERLEKQTKELAAHFNNPSKFVAELKHIFEYYANRIKQSEGVEKSHSLLLKYNLPPPVLTSILLELEPHISPRAAEALELVDVLWEGQIFEAQLLAIYILGTVEIESPNLDQDEQLDNIIGRSSRWNLSISDEELRIALAQDGLKTLRENYPAKLLDMIKKWLNSDKNLEISFGFLTLKALIDNPKFENLPKIYKLIKPFVAASKRITRADLLLVIKSCAHKSAVETVVFLEEVSTKADMKPFRWLVRYSLAGFPDGLQPRLSKLLRTLSA